MHKSFSKESIRALRLRLGWGQSDLARNLGTSLDMVEALESGKLPVQGMIASQLEILSRHADQVSQEVYTSALAEGLMEEAHLEQVDSEQLMLQTSRSL